MATALRHRPHGWTPKAIPFGTLILLLGLWAVFAPLVGGYFGFGFYSHTTWRFPAKWWELHFAGGVASAAGGFLLATPARGVLGRLLAFLGGAWLLAGWAFYPVWANGTIEPYGGAFMHGLRWLGHLVGPGGLILLFTGVVGGLFLRRPAVEQAPPEPLETPETPQTPDVTVPE